MMKKARWMLLPLAAIFFVPCAWAAVQVVDADGTIYSVGVVESGRGQSSSAALSYSVIRLGRTIEVGWVAPVAAHGSDRDPSLMLVPGVEGPALVWGRKDGAFTQIAYSRFTGRAWTEPRYLSSGPRDHFHPQVAVDARGTGTVIWVEPTGSGAVMFATFDPASGNLITSARDLFEELVRHSPAEWLTPDRSIPIAAGRPDPAVILLDGGNDAPAIPPASNHKCTLPGGSVTTNPACTKTAAAVVKERALFIGVLESGEVLKYYRSMIPAGAPGNYTELLLQSLLNKNCQ